MKEKIRLMTNDYDLIISIIKLIIDFIPFTPHSRSPISPSQQYNTIHENNWDQSSDEFAKDSKRYVHNTSNAYILTLI